MSDEDLETTDDLGKWDAAVALPLLDSFDVVDHDHEIFLLALVMDFALGCVATRHFDVLLREICLELSGYTKLLAREQLWQRRRLLVDKVKTERSCRQWISLKMMDQVGD